MATEVFFLLVSHWGVNVLGLKLLELKKVLKSIIYLLLVIPVDPWAEGTLQIKHSPPGQEEYNIQTFIQSSPKKSQEKVKERKRDIKEWMQMILVQSVGTEA